MATQIGCHTICFLGVKQVSALARLLTPMANLNRSAQGNDDEQ